MTIQPSRIRLGSNLGTIRYVGTVDDTPGEWLGIEWDDPQRGKHDGSKNGKRYFSCRSPYSGSFVRPSASISYGRTFLEALTSRYIEKLHGSESHETVVLGSSNGAIKVEAVQLDKIRKKFADLRSLREVSLDGQDVARCDAQGTIQSVCPNVRGLDLSSNLFSGWDVVALISRELSDLSRLALNRNRLESGAHSAVMETAFLNLMELQLNATMMTWREIRNVTAIMPRLEVLEIGYNELMELDDSNDDFHSLRNSKLRVFNLDGNRCSDWHRVWKELRGYPCLERVVLTSNWVNTIPFREDKESGLKGVKYISLSYNKIETWEDVDALSSWCPDLETLTLSGNPLTRQEPEGHWRPFTISRIPTLLTLDGAVISAKERADSEIFYLSYVMRETNSEDERAQAHPQWLRLCEKHGRPGGKEIQTRSKDKLGGQLIALSLHREGGEQTLLRVLPTMKLRAVKQKICKMFNMKGQNISLWLEQVNGRIELKSEQESLGWLGVEDGDKLIFNEQPT